MKPTTIALMTIFIVSVAPSSAWAENELQRITIERGPCLGTCPVYRFSIDADGAGRFEGIRFTTAHGQHFFRVTSEAWASFQTALAPYRPRGSEDVTRGHPRCKQMATDHPSVSVTWTDGRRVDRLRFNFGCRDPQNEEMARALAEAPNLLPVADLIEQIRLEDGELHGRRP